MSAQIPLAWLQLVRMKGRLVAAVAGIAFAVILALVQMAFQDALYVSITQLYSHFNADLVLISPRYQCIIAPDDFPERRLYQALAVDGVQSISSVYMDMAQWINPVNHYERQIFVVGFKPEPGVLDLPSVNQNLAEIAEPDKILFDEGSRPEFGPIGKLFRQNGSITSELSHRHVQVVGLFRVGASFANDGNVITSDTNFLRIAPYRQLGIIDIGLIRVKPGTDVEAARTKLASMLPRDVTVLTKQGFLDREKNYWASSMPIGFVLGVSLIMGLVVGVVIVYQILYSDVSEHLAEFATLKAIGYSDRRLFWIVVQESLILAVMGFFPGLLMALGVYQIARSATVLPIQMTGVRLVVVFILTLVMCGISGCLAVRKLRSADPAEIF
ncbi:MAG: FtsX-like permease family protein [Acidobacteriaceae bacterium]|nr:FtsX-like permease family protein [Acidobacteriaceae bacterium]